MRLLVEAIQCEVKYIEEQLQQNAAFGDGHDIVRSCTHYMGPLLTNQQSTDAHQQRLDRLSTHASQRQS